MAERLSRRLHEYDNPVLCSVEIDGVNDAESALECDLAAYAGALVDVNLDDSFESLKQDGYVLARKMNHVYDLGIVMMSYHSGYHTEGIPFLSKDEIEHRPIRFVAQTIARALATHEWTDPQHIQEDNTPSVTYGAQFDHQHLNLWQGRLDWLKSGNPPKTRNKGVLLLPEWKESWIPIIVKGFIEKNRSINESEITQLVRQIATYSARLSMVVYAMERTTCGADSIEREKIKQFIENVDLAESPGASLVSFRELLSRVSVPVPEDE